MAHTYVLPLSCIDEIPISAGGFSNLLRGFITLGMTEAREAVVLEMRKRGRESFNM